jgi:hypothetical protein
MKEKLQTPKVQTPKKAPMAKSQDQTWGRFGIVDIICDLALGVWYLPKESKPNGECSRTCAHGMRGDSSQRYPPLHGSGRRPRRTSGPLSPVAHDERQQSQGQQRGRDRSGNEDRVLPAGKSQGPAKVLFRQGTQNQREPISSVPGSRNTARMSSSRSTPTYPTGLRRSSS